MPGGTGRKIPIWSASSIDAFITCPHKYYRLRVAKDVEDMPPSQEVLYGRRLHKMFENAVNFDDPLPPDYTMWDSLLKKIKAMPGEKHPEHSFFLDRNLVPCDRKVAWMRGAADLVIISGKQAVILDYKTGKRKPSDQLMLYAGMAFAQWPELEKVTTAYVWLKDRAIDKKTYTKDDIAHIWQTWLPLASRFEHAYDSDTWQMRPSGLCRKWCPVKDCKYCGV